MNLERFPLGDPIVEVLHGKQKYPFRLVKDFIYCFPGDKDFSAFDVCCSKDFTSDMFSIPSFLKGLINPIGPGMHGAIVHDVLCATEYGEPADDLDRKVLRANRILRQAMLDSGSSKWRAWVVYQGVQIGCKSTYKNHIPEEVTDDLILMSEAMERWNSIKIIKP